MFGMVVWCGGVVNVCEVVQTLVPSPGVRMISKVASQGVGTLGRSWMDKSVWWVWEKGGGWNGKMGVVEWEKEEGVVVGIGERDGYGVWYGE